MSKTKQRHQNKTIQHPSIPELNQKETSRSDNIPATYSIAASFIYPFDEIVKVQIAVNNARKEQNKKK
jgi:hypothetical protein